MTQSAVVFTAMESSQEAGNSLGNKILEVLQGKTPHVVILFASSVYEYESLLKALNQTCKPDILVGCSSAGEFTSFDFSTDSACAVAIHSTDIQFSAGLGTGIKNSRTEAVEQLFSSLRGVGRFDFPYQSGLVLADALSGHTDEVIDLLTERTGSYQFFGGGAGDDAKFEKTHVFFGEQAVTDAAILLEILSTKPVGIGVQHGWKPVGEKMRVTASDGMQLISLNGIPTVEVLSAYADASQQLFDTDNPMPFFLHNILGLEMEDGYKLRVPLSVQPDGSILFASDIPLGAIISFMTIESQAATQAAQEATNMALEKLNGSKPSVAFFFDCVATRLRMGNHFEKELAQVKKTLGDISYVGCNTYGQIARVDGQFSGFHNCTAVVCVIPE
ncbi:MAG: FIST N-terminal domain-containing protein [Bacteroidota bacterium]